jgi:glycerol kinase
MESTAWGVAALAGIKAGLIAGMDEVSSNWQHDLTFKPEHDRSADYAGWHKAILATFAQAASPGKEQKVPAGTR